MSRKKAIVGGWLLAVVAIAGFVSLGMWQIGRGHQKQAMLTAVERVLDARRPATLSVAADRQKAHNYDWVAGEGSFADVPAVLLDNQLRDGHAGVRIYRLFLSTQGTPLLIELGWQPMPGVRRVPDAPRPIGKMTIQGLLTPPPSLGISATAAAPQENGTLLMVGLDLDYLRQAFEQPNLAPRVLKLDPALPMGYVRDLDILPNTLPPERHYGYAVTWFGMALAAFAIAFILTFRPLRRRASGS